MGAPHGSSCKAVNECSTPTAFAGNTGSTPEDAPGRKLDELTARKLLIGAGRGSLHRLVRSLARTHVHHPHLEHRTRADLLCDLHRRIAGNRGAAQEGHLPL